MKKKATKLKTAPFGMCWECPDCLTWSVTGETATAHRDNKKHRDPALVSIQQAKNSSMQRIGGLARAASLTPDQRRDISRRAAQARWSKNPVKGTKCAICRKGKFSHKEGTLACPSGDGFDSVHTFLSKDLVPKTKQGLIEAYAMALDSIDRMQIALLKKKQLQS